MFESLKCAAKLNLAVGFVLKNEEDWSCRSHFAHETNTLFEQSTLVDTKEDLPKTEKLLRNTDVIETGTTERANTKWKFYPVKNVSIFPEIFKEVLMGCRDTVSRDPLPKKSFVRGITFAESTRKPYIDNLCLLGTLALHWHGIERPQ